MILLMHEVPLWFGLDATENCLFLHLLIMAITKIKEEKKTKRERNCYVCFFKMILFQMTDVLSLHCWGQDMNTSLCLAYGL